MLPKLFSRLDCESVPAIRRSSGGKDTTGTGAYSYGADITFTAEIPRTLGASAAVLRIARDGCEDQDIPFAFLSTQSGTDCYAVTLQTADLCESCGGLFYYEILFLRGEHTLFTDSIDNVEFSLSPAPSNRFRLLVYKADFQTPEWFHSGTMYHIFVDRFCKGDGKTALRPGSELNPDWENGIPQYANRPGDPLSNNIFFGGNLWGVAEKLDRLASMEVTVLYLSPVFESASNHRYDTGNYEAIDSLLGGEEAFDHLVAEAHKRGIRLILDGVFNHTGDDSKYFNRRGNYPGAGAYQSKSSPYYPWYSFRSYPDDYECWWGVDIMPRLNHDHEECRTYFTGKNGIAAKWLLRGADGWRLDVADELSDDFLDEFRKTVKETSNGNALIVGEVWENAADKTAYGKRRRYLLGDQLDSVMNYPFRNAVLALLQNGDTEFFVHTLTEIYASYPRPVCDSLMNLLGTHDTPRILTLLGNSDDWEDKTNPELATLRLTPAQKKKAIRLLKIASALQFTVYGVPSVYYGDEAGLEGYRDPFCRMPYPWGRENQELLDHYRMLGALRKQHPAFHGGSFRFLSHTPGSFLFEREQGNDRVLIAVNLGIQPHSFQVPGEWTDLISQTTICNQCLLKPGNCAILVK